MFVFIRGSTLRLKFVFSAHFIPKCICFVTLDDVRRRTFIYLYMRYLHSVMQVSFYTVQTKIKRTKYFKAVIGIFLQFS